MTNVDPSRTRVPAVGPTVALAEILASAVEAALVVVPVAALLRGIPGAAAQAWSVGAVVLGLLVASSVRALDILRPVLAAVSAKRRGQALGADAAAAVQGAPARAAVESGWTRAAIWAGATAYIGAQLARAGQIAPIYATGLAAVGILHGIAAGALRSMLWERLLSAPRRSLLPNWDTLRAFASTYRRRLSQTALALFGVTHAVTLALGAVFTDLASPHAGALLTLTLPAIALPGVLWYRSLWRRTLPIERYLDVAVRKPSTFGLSREDPRAIEAFRAAQSLPYRMAAYQVLASAFASVGMIALGRRLVAFDAAAAGRLLGAVALVLLAMGLYETLLLRVVLRPLLGQLGARHRLPPDEVRSTVSVRAKLVGFFVSVTTLGSGLVLLFALSPARAPTTMVGAMALAIAMALGLVLLVVREIVAPIRALEARSDEMGRGELARPVPPAGEADEIGRLTFAFEEMRRALRDKLRSTESINVDLEREVRRRTEALEQRNAELHEALEKLRRAQDDLIRTEKLASMGRLVAGIAHEINNPINAVINSLGPLEEVLSQIKDMDGGPAITGAAGEAADMLRVIQRGAARTKAIVQALHNYSRGDEQTPRELSLTRSIEDTVDLLRHRLKSIRLEKDVPPDLRVRGFAGQIDQVFMNLITNAAQAIGPRAEGGTIRITAAVSGNEAVITVSDDGPGIPPEILPRIFDPFFTTKDVGEGSGLGLSIVHGIIERHGGRIQVESEPGKGTTFRIALPLKAPAAAGAGDSPPA